MQTNPTTPKKDTITSHVYEHSHQVFEFSRNNKSETANFLQLETSTNELLHSKLTNINAMNALKDRADLPETFFQADTIMQIPDIIKQEVDSSAINSHARLATVSSKDKKLKFENTFNQSNLYAQEQQSLPQQPFLEHQTNTSIHWKSKKNKQKRRTMNSKEKRRDGLFQIQKLPHQTFETYLPLHELWKQYMWEVLCTNENALKAQPLDHFTPHFADTVLKSDLHGCIIKVARSKCYANVDIEGIIIQETEQSFRIIDKQDNQCKTLLKSVSLFLFELEIPERLRTNEQQSLRCYLIGDHLVFRSFDRASRKLKRREEVYLD